MFTALKIHTEDAIANAFVREVYTPHPVLANYVLLEPKQI